MRFSITFLGMMALSGVAHTACVPAIEATNNTCLTGEDEELIIASCPAPNCVQHLTTLHQARQSLETLSRMPRFAWIKKGKQHCLLEGVFPCVRDCGKEYLAQRQKPYVGTCKGECHMANKDSEESCTDTSDDDYGFNLPVLIKEVQKGGWKPTEALLESLETTHG